MSTTTMEQFQLRVNGQACRCDCGCNVFHKPDEARPNVYECNACGEWYEGEPATPEEGAER